MTDYVTETLATAPSDILDGPTLAVIAADVALMSDGAYIRLPDVPGLRFGPCRWQARDATSKPAAGNACLVHRDDQANLWVTCWWPYGNIG